MVTTDYAVYGLKYQATKAQGRRWGMETTVKPFIGSLFGLSRPGVRILECTMPCSVENFYGNRLKRWTIRIDTYWRILGMKRIGKGLSCACSKRIASSI